MGDSLLYCCSLCCNTTFDSKQSLMEHLVNMSLNIVCPVCNLKFSSLELLIDHLNVDNCEVINSVQNEVYDNELCIVVKVENDRNAEQITNSTHTHNDNDVTQKNYFKGDTSTETLKLTNSNNGTDFGKMYVELLNKQKPCLQTQELKLVKEDGESRYVILANDETVLNPGVTIVTKQNNDGTISLTTLRDTQGIQNKELEMEIEDVVSSEEKIDENSEEIYSCNTCEVSFSSVLEHIQNYHNDEDVVVHEPIGENGNLDTTVEFESVVNEEFTLDKQASRRMITETGDIIETPLESDQTAGTKSIKAVIPIKDDLNNSLKSIYYEQLQQANAAPKTKSEITKSPKQQSAILNPIRSVDRSAA